MCLIVQGRDLLINVRSELCEPLHEAEMNYTTGEKGRSDSGVSSRFSAWG